MEGYETTPFDRREGESLRAFKAFKTYCKMGRSRSMRLVAKEVGLAQVTLFGYSTKHHWVERALAWDRAKDAAERQAELEEIKEMKRRHVQAALQLQLFAVTELEKMVEAAEKCPVGSAEHEVILKALKQATDLERLTRGQPDSITETTVKEVDPIDLSRLDLEDLKALRRIREKLNKDPLNV